jgi:hypothetical protein
LESAFADARISAFRPQVDAMRERVRAADDRLKSLFLNDIFIGSAAECPWWTRGVLKNGTGEYVDDIKRRFNIDISSAGGAQ